MKFPVSILRPSKNGILLLSVAIILFFPHSLRIRAGELDEPWDSIRELVDRVEASALEKTVRELSGADTVYIDGDPFVIETRYALSDQKYIALQYLLDEVWDAGYEPAVQTFVLRVNVPDLAGVAVSPGLDTLWVGCMEGTVYRAVGTDGWSGFRKCGGTGHKIFEMKVDPNGRLWAACGLEGGGMGGLFVSVDGGAGWEMRKSGSNIYSLSSITFDHESFGIACGSVGTVLRTVDSGVSWFSLPQATFRYLNLNGSASSGPMHFWIVADGGYLFESEDLGSSWSERNLTYYRLFAIDFADSTHGVIVGDGVAYYTNDGGDSWNEVGVAPGPSTQPELRCVAMADSLRVVAAGGAGKIYLSDNGGIDWEGIDDGCAGNEDIWRVAFAGRERFWTVGRDEVRRIEVQLPPSCELYQFSDTLWGRNVHFRLEGVEKPDNRFVICAHYDAISGSPYVCAPGADDNGTGTAGVLECARLLHGASIDYTVEFIFFDGEELGLRGSHYFAANLDTEAVYEAVINLDMLGYDMYDDMSILIAGRDEPVDSAFSDEIMETIDLLEIPLNPVFYTVPLASDHMSFYDLGVPSVLLIEGPRSELTPDYHSCRDVAAGVDFDYMTECIRAALGTLARAAGYEKSGQDTIPEDIVLYQNRPNPFASNTTITYSLPGCMDVELAVFDVSGRRVVLLDRKMLGPGVIEQVWDGRNDSGRLTTSGIYFLRLRAGAHEAVRKIVIIR